MRDGGAAVKLTDGQGTHIQAPRSPRLMGGGHLRPGCRDRHSKPSKSRHFSPLPTTHGSSYVTPGFEMRFLTAYTRNPKSQSTTQQTEEL